MKRSPYDSTHVHKHMKIWNILVITDAFLNQKRENVCEHMVKMMWHHLYRIFTYIYSLLIEKCICDHQNSFQVSTYLCSCVFSYGNLFIFLWVFSLFPYLLSYPNFGTFLLTWSLLIWLFIVNTDYIFAGTTVLVSYKWQE